MAFNINTAIGFGNLDLNNTIFGYQSDCHGSYNSIVGPNNYTKGSYNIIMGSDNIVVGSYNIVLGHNLKILGNNHSITNNFYKNSLLLFDNQLLTKLYLFRYATQNILIDDVIIYLIKIIYDVNLNIVNHIKEFI